MKHAHLLYRNRFQKIPGDVCWRRLLTWPDWGIVWFVLRSIAWLNVTTASKKEGLAGWGQNWKSKVHWKMIEAKLSSYVLLKKQKQNIFSWKFSLFTTQPWNVWSQLLVWNGCIIWTFHVIWKGKNKNTRSVPIVTFHSCLQSLRVIDTDYCQKHWQSKL